MDWWVLHGKAEPYRTGGRQSRKRVSASPCLRVPVSPRPRVSVSPHVPASPLLLLRHQLAFVIKHNNLSKIQLSYTCFDLGEVSDEKQRDSSGR
jgi:hypothetical protein